MTENKYEQIRRRAHEIWQNEGRPEGADLRHWQQACDELGDESNGGTSQEQREEVDRDEAAMLQGAGDSGDVDPGGETSLAADKRSRNIRPAKPAAPDVEITTGEKPSRQKIRKTEGR